jgi:hypothetical protein
VISSTTRNDRRSSAAAALVSIAGVLACGCLSVDDRELSVKRGGIVLTSFEVTDDRPPDLRFRAWQEGVANTDSFVVQATLIDPGYNSAVCLQLDWNMTDPANGAADGVAAFVRTETITPVDLRTYTRVVFAQQYARLPGSSCGFLDVIAFRVMCGPRSSGYESTLYAAHSWEVDVLDFADFHEIPSLAHGVALADCLHAVDAIEIRAQPTLDDGACSSGSLQIDDVSIR